MKRVCCALLVSFGLSGCAELEQLYGTAETDEVVVAASPPPPAAPADEFCRRVAAQEAALGNPTRETQARRIEANFRDCVATFGGI